MNTTKNKVFGISELSDKILVEWAAQNPSNQAESLFLSKKYHNRFNASFPEAKFQEFLVEYCDKTTNPRWAFHAWKSKGTNRKLDYYYMARAAIIDFPWKHALTVFGISTAINFAFQGIEDTPLKVPAVLTTLYFLCAHVITLFGLFVFNCCTNVKSLFRNMAIFMILLNLTIKIAISI